VNRLPLHNLLKPGKTRWLTYLEAVNRVLEQYDALKAYIFETDENEHTVYRLRQYFNDPQNKAFLLFLSGTLPLLNQLNLLFQSDKVLLHIIYDQINSIYKTVLNYFIEESYLNECGERIFLVNPKLTQFHKNLDSIYIKFSLKVYLDKYDNIRDHVLTQIMKFYATAAEEIRNRFIKNDNISHLFRAFEPKIALNMNIESNRPSNLTQLLLRFPNLYLNNINKSSPDEIDMLWNKLPHDNSLKQFVYLPIDKFWSSLLNLSIPNYKPLANFVFAILTFPVSSAFVERIFSQVSLNKTKFRNCLRVASLDAHLKIKSYLNSNNLNCISFYPLREMRQNMVTEILYRNINHNSNVENLDVESETEFETFYNN
jgi:hypothetical protein